MDSTVQDGQLWASPPFVQHHPCPDSQEKGRQRLTRSRRLTVCEYPPESLEITVVLELSTTTTSGKPSPAYGVLWDFGQYHRLSSSEGALQQAVAATPSGTYLLGPKPFHHVACVAAVPTGQAEVG